MTDARYNIVFTGDLVPGSDISAVKQNLGKLFKLDAARVDAMFNGKPVILKKEADQATAMKFRAVLKQAGAQCRMEPIGEVEEVQAAPAPELPDTTPSAPSAPSAPAAAPAASFSAKPVSTGPMDMVGTIRTGGTGFSGEFDVAPPGADMADHVEGPAPIVPDVSTISMAPVGSDMGQLKKDEAPKVPDISHLSVAPPGATLSDEK